MRAAQPLAKNSAIRRRCILTPRRPSAYGCARFGLPPGFILGSHEIVGLLGAGGMGEVYRAQRYQAQSPGRDQDAARGVRRRSRRVARFHREAQAVAALNHPDIAGIHDLAESGRDEVSRARVDRRRHARRSLRRGPVPAEEALRSSSRCSRRSRPPTRRASAIGISSPRTSS